MPERTIRCLLFDLGSTLWERKDQAALRAGEQAANNVAAATLRQHTRAKKLLAMDTDELGRLLRVTVEKHILERTRQHPDYEPDFALATLEALKELGVTDASHERGEAIYEALRIPTPAVRMLFDDTPATLARLKERGYRLGVVSNRHYGGRPFYDDLQCMGLLDYIQYEHMAISADLGVRKPHPAIFLHALRVLQASPQEAAMVGDSLRADIAGAKSLGLLAVWKPKHSLRIKAAAAYRSEHTVRSEQEKNVRTSENGSRYHSEVPGDYLLSYALARRGGDELPPALRRHMTPDVIIKDLSDLLRLFPGPGA